MLNHIFILPYLADNFKREMHLFFIVFAEARLSRLCGYWPNGSIYFPRPKIIFFGRGLKIIESFAKRMVHPTDGYF